MTASTSFSFHHSWPSWLWTPRDLCSWQTEELTGYKREPD